MSSLPTQLRFDALKIAREQLHRGEMVGNNTGPYVLSLTRGKRAAWCAAFVHWCYSTAYAASDRIFTDFDYHVPFTLGGRKLFRNFLGAGVAREIDWQGGEEIRQGDLGSNRYSSNPMSWKRHVWFIDRPMGGGLLATIEGNVGSFPALVKPWYKDLKRDRIDKIIRVGE